MLKIIKTNLNHNFHSEIPSFDIYNTIHGMSVVYQNVSKDVDDGFELSDAGGTAYEISKIWGLSNDQINDENYIEEFVEELDSDIVNSAELVYEIRSALVENWKDAEKYHEDIILNEVI